MSAPLDPLNPNPVPTGGKLGNASPAPAAPDPVPPEEAGSQALSEALRSSFGIVKVIMVLLVVVFFASGVFTVPSQERAIILRFGRPVGIAKEQLLGPGLHWSFPYPIDEVVRIPISQVQSVTSTTGWYAGDEDPNSPAPTVSLNPASDGYTITGDGNIIHVRATLRYRINEPLNYTLNFVNASNILQNALDNALVRSTAQFTVDQALMSAPEAYKERILARVQDVIDTQGLGVTIQTADITPVPPRQVRQAFLDVVTAGVKRGQAITEANSYASSNLTTAVGEAKSIVDNSETERNQLVQALAADANYFSSQLPHYRSESKLFLARLQTETFQRIFTNAQHKVLRMDNGQRPMRISISPEFEKPRTSPNQRQ